MAGKRVARPKIALGYLLLDDDATLRRRVIKTIREEVLRASKSRELDDKCEVTFTPVVKGSLKTAKHYVTASTSLPDWVLVDERLEGSMDGKQLVEELHRVGYPADVLFYSNASMAPPLDKGLILRYGRIRSTGKDSLSAYIYQMAEEFLTKWSDPEYVRGLVLSRAVDVDLAIDDCIVKFFKIEDEEKSHFTQHLLGANGVRLGAKLDIIEKAVNLLKSREKDQTYQDISKGKIKEVFESTRNKFAHTILLKDPGNPFKIQLEYKSGSVQTVEKDDLDAYFLKCSRMIENFRILESDLSGLYAEKQAK